MAIGGRRWPVNIGGGNIAGRLYSLALPLSAFCGGSLPFWGEHAWCGAAYEATRSCALPVYVCVMLWRAATGAHFAALLHGGWHDSAAQNIAYGRAMPAVFCGHLAYILAEADGRWLGGLAARRLALGINMS